MYISLQNIKKLFPDRKSEISSHARARGLTCCSDISEAVTFQRSALYPLDSLHQLDLLQPVYDIHFLLPLSGITNREDLSRYAQKYHADILALEYSPGDLPEIREKLNTYFEYQIAYALLSDSLLEILSNEKGIQEMVNHTYMFMENPIFVFDSDFMLIAANWDEVSSYPGSENFITETGLTSHSFPLLENMDHIHDRMLKSAEPIRVCHPEIGVEQMVCAISTGRDLGHVVACALNRPFRDYDNHSLKLLASAIRDQMQKNEFVRNNQGFNYELFISDILDGKIATEKQYLDRLSYVNVAFSDLNYCLVADMARSSRPVHPAHIRDTFEHLIPGTKALIYHGALVAVFSRPPRTPFSAKEKEKLKHTAQKYGLCCGISNPFESVLFLKDYYVQALRATELGADESPETGIYLYSDYALKHVQNIFAQRENIKSFCHPFLNILLGHDRANQSNTAYTWYMYLVHERNLVATAKAMCLHRNTLAYHLKKIHLLVEENQYDFDLTRERLYYIISYELLFRDRPAEMKV